MSRARWDLHLHPTYLPTVFYEHHRRYSTTDLSMVCSSRTQVRSAHPRYTTYSLKIGGGVHIINDVLVPDTLKVAARALSSQDGVSPPTLSDLRGGDVSSSQDGSSSLPMDVSMLAFSSQDGALQPYLAPDHEMDVSLHPDKGTCSPTMSATSLSY